MPDGIEIPIQATGGDAAAKEVAKPLPSLQRYIFLAQQANKAEQEAIATKQRLAASMNAATNSTDGLRKGFAGLAEGSSKLGAASSLLSGELGQLGGTFGKVAGAAQGFLGIMGGGTTLGFAAVTAGGALAAGLLVKELVAIARESEQANKFLEAQAETTKRLAAEIGTLAQVRARHNQRTFENQRAAQAAEADEASWWEAHQSALRGNQADAQQEAQDRYLSVYGTPEQRGESRGGGSRPARNARFEAAMREGTGGIASQSEVDSIMFGGLLGNDNGLDRFIGRQASASTVADKVGGAQRSMKDSAIADAKAVKSAWLDAGSAMTDGLGQSFAALITGGQEAAAAMLANLGDQMVAEGSRGVFSGLLATAMGNPLGPTMVAIGAAEIAFGAGLGATMSGASAGSGGGGARPSAGMSRDEARESGPTVINVYSLDPTRDAGKAMDRAQRMANRKKMAAA